MDNQIGNRIREIRDKLGLTQKNFGLLIGKGQEMVHKYEAGKVMPPADTYQRIIDLDPANRWKKKAS